MSQLGIRYEYALIHCLEAKERCLEFPVVIEACFSRCCERPRTGILAEPPDYPA